jgi:hypothetical protein
MDDQRAPFSVGTESLNNEVVHRRDAGIALERNRQQPRGLVHDQQPIVFVNDAEIAEGAGARPGGGGAGAVDPDADGVAGNEEARGIVGRRLVPVEVDLAPREGRRSFRAGSQPIGRREELVEPDARILRPDRPPLALRVRLRGVS